MPAYLKRAKKRFLQGVWYASPVEAVLAGKRTLEDWVDLVAFERDLERQTQTRRPYHPRAARAFKIDTKDLS